MRPLLALLILTATATPALAGGNPLEAAALQQVASQAPGATAAVPFFVGNGDRAEWQVLLDANQCYWFSGVSSGKIKKIVLLLYGPTGFFRLGMARSETGQATLAYCTQESGMYKLQAKVEGKGEFGVGVFAKAAPARSYTAQGNSDLGSLCDKEAAAAAPGARHEGGFFDGKGGTFGGHDRKDYSIAMTKGQCYWVVGCGEPNHVKALWLYLWGPDNKRITEAKPDSPNVMVGHCTTETGMFKVQSVVGSGSGAYKVGVYHK
jgi:hypothetical protein